MLHLTDDTRKHTRANLLMLVAAMIWGSAFVAQRLSLDTIGPFLFTGLRFLLGSAVVLALCLTPGAHAARGELAALVRRPKDALPGIALGLVLSVAISLQQIGLQYTKIANAGFISSLYVVIVPLAGALLGHRTRAATWLGALLAAVGLYFLSVQSSFEVSAGDLYQLACAIVIAGQVLLVGRFARSRDPLVLALVQFVSCGAVCLAVALALEPVRAQALVRAWPTIVYGGALSVGIGYTLQVVSQRDAAPAHAAIIFSMEGVFAALSGWLALGETLSPRALAGAALMLLGLVLSQYWPSGTARVRRKDAPKTTGRRSPSI